MAKIEGVADIAMFATGIVALISGIIVLGVVIAYTTRRLSAQRCREIFGYYLRVLTVSGVAFVVSFAVWLFATNRIG